MNFTEYKDFCYSHLRPDLEIGQAQYVSLKLFAETGEFVGKVSSNQYHHKDNRIALVDEAGDCLWYWVNLGTIGEFDPVKLLQEYTVMDYFGMTLIEDLGELAWNATDLFHDLVLYPTAKPVIYDWIYYLKYFLTICYHLNLTLHEIIDFNVDKLNQRLPKGVYNQHDFNTLNREH